ncbi:MAG: hypothetical protein ACK44O_10240, partial [Novosphingobium sp.]
MSTLLGLALAVTLASCDNASDRAVEVAVIGESASPFAGGARLPLAAQLVRSATAEGLVGFDERGRVIPALADRWIVTDDGLGQELEKIGLGLVQADFDHPARHRADFVDRRQIGTQRRAAQAGNRL